MKITVKKEEKTEKIDWKDLTTGTVFEYENGITGLKIRGGVLYLIDGLKQDWLEETSSPTTTSDPIKKILGTIDEIIVKKEENLFEILEKIY